MILKLKKEEIKNLITKYYQEFENRHVFVKISNKKQCVGYHEILSCLTIFTIIEDVEIMGIKSQIKECINEEQLKTIFASLIDQENFVLESLTLNNGLNERVVGYYMSEHIESTPYFNGITLNFKSKDKNLSRVRGV